MNFKQLEYFTCVAQEKSISKAARQLHVAQPPVSRQIALLEEELGVCLFLRNNKGVELTEAGQSLYRQSRRLFQEMRVMVDHVRDVGAGLRGLLKIGIVYSNIPVVMARLKAYHQQYPQVELYIRLGTPKDLLDDLDKGELHVLFLPSPQDGAAGVKELILGEDPLHLVMTEALDPAPGQEEVPVEALHNIPMCLLRSDDLWGYSNHLLSECRKKDVTPNVICQCYDTPMAMQLVREGLGVSFLPRSILETHPNSGIYTKPIRGVDAKSYPTMLWSSDLYDAGCVRKFLELFQQMAASRKDGGISF